MGHSLVTKFDDRSLSRIDSILADAGIFGNNKIPYGKTEDRASANEVLPYHITLYRWSKEEDEKYLSRLEHFRFAPCRVKVTRASVMHGESDSLLLYFKAESADNFTEALRSLEQRMHHSASTTMHITLSVSRDHGKIKQQQIALSENTEFPFYLNIIGIDMYHIWSPIRFSRSY